MKAIVREMICTKAHIFAWAQAASKHLPGTFSSITGNIFLPITPA